MSSASDQVVTRGRAGRVAVGDTREGRVEHRTPVAKMVCSLSTRLITDSPLSTWTPGPAKQTRQVTSHVTTTDTTWYIAHFELPPTFSQQNGT